MCEWQRVSLFPEGPGPYRCPASSSYTVYTKLCMYKIEKSEKKTRSKGDFIRPFCFIENHTLLICQLNPISSVQALKENVWSLCAVCAVNCPLHNPDHWLPSWSLQRYAAGPVTEPLCRKSRSRREIDPVSFYKQHRPRERETALTAQHQPNLLIRLQNILQWIYPKNSATKVNLLVKVLMKGKSLKLLSNVMVCKPRPKQACKASSRS